MSEPLLSYPKRMRNQPNTPFVPKSTKALRISSEEQLAALVEAYRAFGLSENDALSAALADADTQFVRIALAA